MSEIWTEEAKAKAASEAESWLGVKHANHRLDRRLGVDCVHYVMAIYAAAGIVERRDLGKYDVTRGMVRESYELADMLQQCVNCEVLAAEGAEPQFGDVAVFKTGGASAHCGFCDGKHVYHSLAGRCAVKSPWSQWGHKAKFLLRATAPGWKNDPVAVVNQNGGAR